MRKLDPMFTQAILKDVQPGGERPDIGQPSVGTVGNCLKVFRSVIGFDEIPVVDVDVSGERLPYRAGDYETMLQNVAVSGGHLDGDRVFWVHSDLDVPVFSNATAPDPCGVKFAASHSIRALLTLAFMPVRATQYAEEAGAIPFADFLAYPTTDGDMQRTLCLSLSSPFADNGIFPENFPLGKSLYQTAFSDQSFFIEAMVRSRAACKFFWRKCFSFTNSHRSLLMGIPLSIPRIGILNQPPFRAAEAGA